MKKLLTGILTLLVFCFMSGAVLACGPECDCGCQNGGTPVKCSEKCGESCKCHKNCQDPDCKCACHKKSETKCECAEGEKCTCEKCNCKKCKCSKKCECAEGEKCTCGKDCKCGCGKKGKCDCSKKCKKSKKFGFFKKKQIKCNCEE